PNLGDELGLAASIGWSSGVAIDIVDNTHPVTAPFAIAPLSILAAASDLANVSGTLAPDLRTLGSESAGPMLVTLEAMAERIDSQASAGRRIQLPWGGSNFVLDNLTNDGKTLLHRALNWAAQPPPRCDADFVVNRRAGDVNWPSASGDVQGIDYVPAGLVINSVAMPTGGGWLMIDPNKDKLFVTDTAGNDLTELSLPFDRSTAVALLDAGQWVHHIAATDKGLGRLYYLDLEGEIEWSFSTWTLTPGDILGASFIGATASGDYDNHLALVSDKNASGGGDATVYIIDQTGGLQKTIDIELLAPNPTGITHLTGADKLLITDSDGVVSVIDFDGNLLRRYFGAQLGITKINNVVINPLNCDHVMIDDAIETIASLDYVAPDGNGPTYVEMLLPWIAVAEDSWETVNLGIYGVPANAVVEVAVVNTDGGKEWFGGVRAVGSTLDRRLSIHEAEGGGMDVVTMHVQSDSAGRIEYYSDDMDKLSFILLGYWPDAAYVENWQSFKAGASGSWETHNLQPYGVGPDEVAEILMANGNSMNARQAGARTRGSSLSRLFDLHEAHDGGEEIMSLFVAADSDTDARIEVYAEANNNVDFYLLGHWSTPPGSFTSAFEDLGRPTAENIWQAKDVGAHGVPAHAVAQIALINREDGAKALLGMRQLNSVLERQFEFHKGRIGSEELASEHVKTDENAEIEWYDDDLLRNHGFFLLGWWH
ncbi:MAG: hypothetical protein KJN72_00700, partial [Woeseia sp.]|nr:hypothetical protein [Woeseia sp.]